MRNTVPLVEEIQKLEAELEQFGTYGEAFKKKPGKVRRLVELCVAVDVAVGDDILKMVGLTRREAWKRGWRRL